MVALAVILLVILVLFPHPASWGQILSDGSYPRAVVRAYGIALRVPRVSRVPLTGLTYEVLVYNASREEIEVVFLPREFVLGLTRGDAPDEIHIVIRRRTLTLSRVYLGE